MLGEESHFQFFRAADKFQREVATRSAFQRLVDVHRIAAFLEQIEELLKTREADR